MWLLGDGSSCDKTLCFSTPGRAGVPADCIYSSRWTYWGPSCWSANTRPTALNLTQRNASSTDVWFIYESRLLILQFLTPIMEFLCTRFSPEASQRSSAGKWWFSRFGISGADGSARLRLTQYSALTIYTSALNDCYKVFSYISLYVSFLLWKLIRDQWEIKKWARKLHS